MNKQQYNPFTDIDYDSSPDYLENLYKVFVENFIVEVTKTDRQSRSLFQILDDKDWENLKHLAITGIHWRRT